VTPLLWKAIAGAVMVAAVVLFIRGYGSRQYQAGGDAVRAADAKAMKVLAAHVREIEDANHELATTAHDTYEVEHVANVIAARQPLTASQLCQPADDRGGRLPEAGAAQRGNEAASTTADVGGPVPAPDHGQPDDRRRLLAAFAALLDDQDAVIREFQAREGKQSLAP
jgi:hypothetical protein